MSHHRKLPSALRADCSRCAGLCCVVPAFDAVQGFGFDKPPCTPCAHLTDDNRCAIYEQRAASGFVACVGFDCYGAGQHVTTELGLDLGWRKEERDAAPIFSAYKSFVVLHRLMAALTHAATTVPPNLRAPLRLRRMELNRLCRTEEARNDRLDLAKVESDTFTVIRRLRATVGGDAT